MLENALESRIHACSMLRVLSVQVALCTKPLSGSGRLMGHSIGPRFSQAHMYPITSGLTFPFRADRRLI